MTGVKCRDAVKSIAAINRRIESNTLGARAGRRSAFTLIEMVGLLAIMAILASLLLAKVFEAISNARVNQTAMEIQSTQTAVMDHYAKFGALASSNGVALQVPLEHVNFDLLLLNEGFSEKPFQSKLTDNAFIRLVAVGGFNASTSIQRDNGAYDLDGDGNNDIRGASFAIDAVLIGLTLEDAVALNNRIDGPALGQTGSGSDTKGRVRYAVFGGAGDTGGGGGSGTSTNNGNGNGNSYSYGHYKKTGTATTNSSPGLRLQVHIAHH